MEISFFYRAKNTSISIERVFSDVIDFIKRKNEIKKITFSPRLGRIQNCFKAKNEQGDINHITGDIHFLALFLKYRKTVLTIHDLNHLKNLKGLRKIFYQIFWFELPLRSVKYITTISLHTKNELIKKFRIRPEKIIVIHNPLTPIFKFYPKNFDKQNPKILQIGSIPNKNVERLIEAVKRIQCTLILVRNPNTDIEQKLNEYQISYQWFSNVDDQELLEIYKSCDILFFASTAEGFGLPIIEANAVGRPVLTSNISSMPEIAGDAALFVNPYSVDEIAEGIQNLINDERLREKLIQNGLRNCQRFELEHIGLKYEQVYNLITNNGVL